LRGIGGWRRIAAVPIPPPTVAGVLTTLVFAANDPFLSAGSRLFRADAVIR
jgi:hypothetical protein